MALSYFHHHRWRFSLRSSALERIPVIRIVSCYDSIRILFHAIAIAKFTCRGCSYKWGSISLFEDRQIFYLKIIFKSEVPSTLSWDVSGTVTLALKTWILDSWLTMGLLSPTSRWTKSSPRMSSSSPFLASTNPLAAFFALMESSTSPSSTIWMSWTDGSDDLNQPVHIK